MARRAIVWGPPKIPVPHLARNRLDDSDLIGWTDWLVNFDLVRSKLQHRSLIGLTTCTALNSKGENQIQVISGFESLIPAEIFLILGVQTRLTTDGPSRDSKSVGSKHISLS